MTSCYRDGDLIVIAFEYEEAVIVHSLVEQTRELLLDRSAAAPRDELAELTGITMGSSTPPDDPILSRLLPDFHRTDNDTVTTTELDSAAALRALHEPGLLDAKIASATVLVDTCPLDGKEARLTLDQAEAWLRTLNDVRLALGVVLDVTEDMPEELPDDDPRAIHFSVYRWLSLLQENLLAMMPL